MQTTIQNFNQRLKFSYNQAGRNKVGCCYRMLWKTKGGGNYQFTFEMQFSIPANKKSPFNIAPVDGKSVAIIKIAWRQDL